MKNPFQSPTQNMTRLTNEQIMDFLDNACTPEERARIEAHLEKNQEDAELVNELRFAMNAAQDWHQSEPVQVSENFWPKLRDNLGPAPSRGMLSSFQKSMRQMFGTSPASRLSLGAAMAAVVVAMGIFLFAPQNAQQPVMANQPTAQDMAFIQQSVQQHKEFVATSPVAGDVSSLETGADEDEEDANP
jgi:anti-sigma factor RsiW